MFGHYFGSPYFGTPYFGPGVATPESTPGPWVAIAEIDLDDASEYIANRTVNHPTRTYTARVLSWGSIERSIPLPSGMPQASRMKIRVDFTNAEFRRRVLSQTLQGRRVRAKFLQAGTSEAAADIHFTGRIDNYETGPVYLSIEATSDLLAWCDEKTPEVINQANFPEFPDVKQQYFQLVLGHVVGRAVSVGFAAGPPAGPPTGALVDAANAADALRVEIDALVFEGGPFSVFSIAQEWAYIENRYNQGLGFITTEFESEYAAGVLEYADATYARTKLQALLDSTDAKADEFYALGGARQTIVNNFRAKVTAFFGTDWVTLLAVIDAKIASVAASPPAELFAPQGAIKLPHIGFLDGVGDRYGASVAGLWNVIAIYRKATGEAIFTPVDPGEYNVTVETRQYGEYPGQDFDSTFIDFLVDQEGAEIQMDADGAYYRAAVGSMPAAGYNPLDSPPTLGPLRNPVDGMLLMRQYIFPKAGEASAFDTVALQSLLEKFRDGGATMPPLLCDAAIAESLTPREIMGRFNSSFQTDFFETRTGLMTMVRIDDTDEDRPVLTESVIIKESFTERSPETVNRYRAQYAMDYSTGQWTALALADNTADQAARGKIEERTFGLWFVRDALTAQAATYDRLRSTAIQSYLQRLRVPLRSVSGFLDLALLMGITHHRGNLVSGYRNREVKVIGTTVNLDRMEATIDSIVRVPLAFGNLRTSGFAAGALAGSAAQLTNRYRPTSHTFNNAPGGGIRGTWADELNVYDGDPDTYTQELLNGGTGGSTFSKLHLHDFEPFSTAGLTAVEIVVDMEYLYHGNVAFPGPLVEMALFDGVDPNPIDDGVDVIPTVQNPTGDVARALHSVTVSAAAWLGLASPTVRLFMWNTAAIYSPDVEAKFYDCYVRPIY